MKRKSKKATGPRTRSRAASRGTQSAVRPASRADPAVSALLRELAHPLAREIELVRGLVLASSPAIVEGVKWNSASYRTTDWFATVHWRSRDSVQLVFHTGAKVKASAQQGARIADPAGLVKWLARDRCLVTLGSGKELRSRAAPFQALVRAWIRQL